MATKAETQARKNLLERHPELMTKFYCLKILRGIGNKVNMMNAHPSEIQKVRDYIWLCKRAIGYDR